MNFILDVKKSKVLLKDQKAIHKKLLPYIKTLQNVIENKDYLSKEASLNCISDTKVIKEVEKTVKQKTSKKLKYIFVIGIGGSNLATKAIYDVFFGAFDLIMPQRMPKIIFLDTNNSETARYLVKFISKHIKTPNEILINIISKSGTTTETIANAEFIIKKLKEKYKNIFDRIVISTDYKSKLWDNAFAKNIRLLEIPKNVGGRFSVFSVVSLFPLLACTIDIYELLKGAKYTRTVCTSNNINTNIAAQSAIFQYYHYKKNKKINVNFFFDPELESLGKWYTQLLAESIGKEYNNKNKKVEIGITPITSIGSTDLHSVGQLYLGGPDDKTTTFITSKSKYNTSKITKSRIFPELLPNLNGKSMFEIITAICNATKKAYVKKELPFCEVILDNISPYEIGVFMQFKMIEIMYLGYLFNINAFDQPNVELYKKEMKKILK